MKNKKLSSFITVLLVAVFTIGTIGVGISISRVSNQLQASVLKNQIIKKKKRKVSRAILSQLVVPETILNPLTVCLYSPPEKEEYKAEFVERETKFFSGENGKAEINLYLKNTGNTVWFGDTSRCTNTPFIRLGTARDRDRQSVFYNPADPMWLQANRIAMVEQRVEPGEIATFKFIGSAPAVSDIFREYFQPLVEGKNWIENKEAVAQVDIYTGQPIPEQEKAVFYLAKSGQSSSLDMTGALAIFIDLSEQKMIVKLGESIVREYKVSTGAYDTPTPKGNFKILVKQDLRIANKWPHYRMPMWMGFSPWGHGLHALPYLANDNGIFWNEALNHIGQRVSHGCVRLLPDDAADLYKIAEMGTPVTISA